MGKVKAFLNKFFRIEERGSTITRELIGGLIVFLAMFYILPVNSFMVGGGDIPGATVGGVFFATAVSAAIATLIMGLLANFPVALAPGMGVRSSRKQLWPILTVSTMFEGKNDDRTQSM